MAEKKPVVADVATQPFWDAAAEGKLLIKHCKACGKAHHYPRPLCPFCFSADTEFRPSKGEGTIYSWSVERRANPPFAIAYVTLPEGVTLMTNIVDADLDTLEIGQKVKVGFRKLDDGPPVPIFTPA